MISDWDDNVELMVIVSCDMDVEVKIGCSVVVGSWEEVDVVTWKKNGMIKT